MDEPTSDRNVVIEARGPAMIRYRALESGRRWTVHGTCNQCGLCVIGAYPIERYAWDGPAGTPFAVRDLTYGVRADEPVTPEFFPAMRRMAQETPTAAVSGCAMRVSV